MWQGGEVETRLAHNQKIGGANPPPATNYLYAKKKEKQCISLITYLLAFVNSFPCHISGVKAFEIARRRCIKSRLMWRRS
jgi:hypothetical protein